MCIAGEGLILPFHVAGSWPGQKEGFAPQNSLLWGREKGSGHLDRPFQLHIPRGTPKRCCYKTIGFQERREGGRKKKSHQKERKQHTRERRALVVSGQAGKRARTFSLD